MSRRLLCGFVNLLSVVLLQKECLFALPWGIRRKLRYSPSSSAAKKLKTFATCFLKPIYFCGSGALIYLLLLSLLFPHTLYVINTEMSRKIYLKRKNTPKCKTFGVLKLFSAQFVTIFSARHRKIEYGISA